MTKIISSQHIIDIVKQAAENGSDMLAPNDLDKIIDKIKLAAAEKTDNGLNTQTQRLQNEKTPVSFYKVKDKPNINTTKLQYHLNELVHFNDEEFIQVAYQLILKRNPDIGGLEYYLGRLKSGKWSKENILFRLLQSKEGKSCGVTITSLIPSLCLRIIYAIPIIGYFAKVSAAIINLPNLVKSVTNVQHFVTELNKNQIYHLNQLSTQLDQTHQMQNKELDDVLEVINNTLGTKASVTELNSLAKCINLKADENSLAPLNERLDNKADKESLMLVSECLDRKADITEIKILSDRLDEKSDLAFVDDADYEEFENSFRGTEEEITERLKAYLELLPEFNNEKEFAVDLGCGRGEWLKLMTEYGYSTSGIDTNINMVNRCNGEGLVAIKSDALAYMQNQPDQSLSLISGFHIIEHVPFNYLLNMFNECFRALKNDGIIIFETPNLKNILVGSGDFYLDPTHRRPLHPLTLQFFLKQAGFTSVEIQYVGKQLINHNNVKFNNINDYVNIPRDYALVCKKS